jgi:hypothetical protein
MFTMYVADNFHYMDEDETYIHGVFATWAEATAAARQIVDESLAHHYRPGMTAADLHRMYTSFGDDPFIRPKPDGEKFSAWDYARQRCDELCAARARQ